MDDVNDVNIAVVGLGKAGLPLAAVIADSGLTVVGVDIDADRVSMINSGANPIPEEPDLGGLIEKHGGTNLIATSRYADARRCNVFIVIVPLFIDDDHSPDFRALESAFRNIGKILKKGDIVYMFSDGYPDQFGGPLGRKFKMVRLKNLLRDIHDKPMDEQYNYIKSNFFLWKEDLEQVDDVLFMGIRI